MRSQLLLIVRSMLTLPRIVESTDARMFGLDDKEVQSRRQYVTHVRKELEVRSVSCFHSTC